MESWIAPFSTCRECLEDFHVDDLNDFGVCYICDKEEDVKGSDNA